jgi:hypothetical protein
MEADFQRVAERLGITGFSLPRLNASVHAPYGSYYDATRRDHVAGLYERDLMKFGYDFDS